MEQDALLQLRLRILLLILPKIMSNVRQPAKLLPELGTCRPMTLAITVESDPSRLLVLKRLALVHTSGLQLPVIIRRRLQLLGVTSSYLGIPSLYVLEPAVRKYAE